MFIARHVVLAARREEKGLHCAAAIKLVREELGAASVAFQQIEYVSLELPPEVGLRPFARHSAGAAICVVIDAQSRSELQDLVTK